LKHIDGNHETVGVLEHKNYPFGPGKWTVFDAYSFSNFQERRRFAIVSRFQDRADSIELAFVNGDEILPEPSDTVYTWNRKNWQPVECVDLPKT